MLTLVGCRKPIMNLTKNGSAFLSRQSVRANRVVEDGFRDVLDFENFRRTVLVRDGGFHSSRSSFNGSSESARCAGIHVASRPRNNIAKITPPSTSGSR